ncbi:MAG: flagellar filament capping protein FliD, partial [Lysobacter sp.]|nr:flagellar filament capping protein FliD [Lysobacter sp.]
MSITSTGIGSGLDVTTLVSQLVASERAPTAQRIDAFESKTKSEISAFGSLRSTLDGLRTALAKLRLPETAQARKASLPDSPNFSVTTTSKAAIGSYDVEVLALSSAHKLASKEFAADTTPVGTGKLTITSGDITLNVDVDDEHKTVDGIRDAINKAAAGKGVVATVVQADDGAHLVLSATRTGAANAVKIAASGGDGGLAVFDNTGATTMKQLDAALDARVKVDGFERSSPTNTIDEMIEGVTFTLTKVGTADVPQTFTVSADTSVLRTAAKAFVTTYNSATTALKSVSSYNAATKVAAPLNGDPLVRGVSRDL